jgi:hypothetical protein
MVGKMDQDEVPDVLEFKPCTGNRQPPIWPSVFAYGIEVLLLMQQVCYVQYAIHQ